MRLLEFKFSANFLRCELIIICLIFWIFFISLPISQGGIGLSWDALNHHIYLGWIAETSRFEKDFLAASTQSYQFPYLYWPVYKMAISGWSGIWVGIVLATMQLITVPPVWMMARTCQQGATLFDVSMRFLAVAMAFMSSVTLSQLTSTSNDLFATAPLIWALALALESLNPKRANWLTLRRTAILSGFCAGASVACKLSNGPLVLVLMPVLWLLVADGSFKKKCLHVFQGGVATLAGYIIFYGYWGWQMWTQFGNPIYPFYDSLFTSIRHLAGPLL